MVLQLLFIADVSRRRVHLPEQERSKPARQAVTFLLICNVTMWLIYTFEAQKVLANPVSFSYVIKVSSKWPMWYLTHGAQCIYFMKFLFAGTTGFLWLRRLVTRSAIHTSTLHFPSLPLSCNSSWDMEDQLQSASRMNASGPQGKLKTSHPVVEIV